LIVDEALSVGDEAFQHKCLNWIDDFRKTGTLLFVSHSMKQVQRLCGRAIWIDDGRVRADGEPAKIISHYRHANDIEPDSMQRFSAV